MKTEDFWNQIYATHQTSIPCEDDPVLSEALRHFGNVKGAKLLDLGCGDGSTSLFFAKQGADVVAIDISEVAIANLSRFCQQNHISNITPIKCSAFEIAELGPFDFVFGNMILHHLEPFEGFAQILRASLTPTGKCFFRENSAVSDLLIWFRNNLVGKYGIPKYGDSDEFPLEPREIQSLKNMFFVKVDYPELLFFRLASWYLFKGRLEKSMRWMDEYFFKYEFFRKYSYRQYLLLS